MPSSSFSGHVCAETLKTMLSILPFHFQWLFCRTWTGCFIYTHILHYRKHVSRNFSPSVHFFLKFPVICPELPGLPHWAANTHIPWALCCVWLPSYRGGVTATFEAQVKVSVELMHHSVMGWCSSIHPCLLWNTESAISRERGNCPVAYLISCLELFLGLCCARTLTQLCKGHGSLAEKGVVYVEKTARTLTAGHQGMITSHNTWGQILLPQNF